MAELAVVACVVAGVLVVVEFVDGRRRVVAGDAVDLVEGVGVVDEEQLVELPDVAFLTADGFQGIRVGVVTGRAVGLVVEKMGLVSEDDFAALVLEQNSDRRFVGFSWNKISGCGDDQQQRGDDRHGKKAFGQWFNLECGAYCLAYN